MLLEKDMLHWNSQFEVNQIFFIFYQISYIILLLSTTDYHYIIYMKYDPCQTTWARDF